METESITGTEGLSKEQLISMIHFLEKRDEASKKNEALKKLIKEPREIHNLKVKSQAGLMAAIDRLTKQVADYKI